MNVTKASRNKKVLKMAGGALAWFFVGAAIGFSCNANALFVQTPNGDYDVEQTADGFVMYGLSGQGISTVTRQDNGYSVQTPQGTTNIYNDGTTSMPGLVVDPLNRNTAPVLH